MRADLHLHSSASDGLMDPVDLQAAVTRRRLEAWSLTDHDTLAGYRSVAVAADARLVPGVEITAHHEGREIHVIGLGVDPGDPGLEDWLGRQRRLRQRRLAQLRAHLDLPPPANGPDPEAVATRVDLAWELIAAGRAHNLAGAFAVHLDDRACRKLDLPPYPDPAAAAKHIHAAGGVAILAHPGTLGGLDLIERVMAGGLDGLELSHPRLSPQLRSLLERLSDAQGWLTSCGSDLHADRDDRLGDWHLPRSRLTPLLRAVGFVGASLERPGG